METKEGRRAKYSHAHDVTTALAKSRTRHKSGKTNLFSPVIN
jgi:hypothetical protein